MEGKHIIRPSGAFYYLGILIGIVGVLGFGLIIFLGLKGSTRGFERFKVPGSLEKQFEEIGNYTVYYEYQSVFKGRAYNSGEELPGLAVKVWDNDSGAEVPVSETSTRNTYSFGGRKGRSIFQFHIAQPGTYTLTGSYLGNQETPEVILSVGRGFGVRLTLTIFIGIGTLFVSIVSSLIIVIVTFLKRDKYKRNLKAQGIPF